MNKKYKLKIDLGGKKAGFVHTQSTHNRHPIVGVCWEDENGVKYETRLANTKVWEEVKEREYEIQTIKYNDILHHLSDEVSTWHNNQVKYISEKDKGFFVLESDLYRKTVYPISIHSVKRTSDGEVFTVGDKITSKCFMINPDVREILSIKVDKNGLYINQCNGISFLKDIELAPKPAFVSEDGVEMFVGDKYYFTGPLNNGVYSLIVSAGCAYAPDKYITRFSTREAGQKYIDSNKTITVTMTVAKHNEIKHLL